jgi:hypothetical protein
VKFFLIFLQKANHFVLLAYKTIRQAILVENSMAEAYPFVKTHSADKQKFVYTFQSEGSRGIITKVVEFECIRSAHWHLYNCAFGDFDAASLEINDRAVSGNGDVFRVMETLVEIVRDFLSQQHHFMIYIFGTDLRRLHLYQYLIGKKIKKLAGECVFYGGFDYLEEYYQLQEQSIVPLFDYYLIRRL